MSGSFLSPTAVAKTTSSAPIGQTGTTALDSLSGNFSSFLSLLMTQLKNQDPSSPMDANQFTTELVQFSGVAQQISTNSDLTQLIQLTRASQVEQSASLIGKPVTVASTQLSLQNGTAKINFSTANAEPVGIAVYDSAGAQVQSGAMTSSAGANSWTWNGQNANGSRMPDGAYKVSITALGANGAASPIPFTVTGTATSVQNNSGTVQIQMGGLILPFSALQSVGN